MFSRFTTTLALAAVLATSGVQAHTYLLSPPSRLSILYGLSTSTADGSGNEKGLCHLGDGTQTCCTSQTMGSSMKTYERGADVPTAYWRNNHVGGFNRYSIVPMDKSNSQANFDAQEAQLSYECAQVGCTASYGGDSPNHWNGGDSAGSKGWSNACSGGFKVPYHLPDGDYTVQWVWYGQGNGNSANSPFQACIDLKISGGPTGAQPDCPLWKGGDLSEKGDNVCSYMSVSNPTYQGVCKSANACSGSYAVGLPAGLAQCAAGNSPSTWPLGMSSSQGGVPNTFDSYAASGSAASSNSTVSTGDTGSAVTGNSTVISSSQSGSSSSTGSKKKCSPGSKRRRHLRRAAAAARRENMDGSYLS